MPKVHYFDVYGRAEMTRMALHYLGVQFENVVHSGEDWAAYKPTTEFGQMPVFELDDGTNLAQSLPIYNYVCATWGGNKEGFVPTDALQNYNGEATVAVLHDDFVHKHIFSAFFMPDGDAKTEKFKNAITVEYPKTAAFLEKRVPAEGFLNGAQLSKWDILFAQFYLNMIRNKNFKSQEMAAGIWAQTPANVQNYVIRVEEVFKDYLAARPQNSF